MQNAMANGRRMNGRDAIIALLLVLLTLLGALGIQNNGERMNSDDFAAYMNEGIAIAKGELDAQIKLYPKLHPSRLPDGASEELMYVWGYPLMLAGVYRAVGYDLNNPLRQLPYKLPSAISLALLAAVLYLFLRRRFSRAVSCFMSFSFVLSKEMMDASNRIETDCTFLFFSMLALWLIEVLRDSETLRRRLLLSIVLSFVMFAVTVLRLNGSTVCMTILLAQFIAIISSIRASGKGLKALMERENRKRLLCALLMWVLYFALRAIAMRYLFPDATSNMGDMARGSIRRAIYNFAYTGFCVLDWLNPFVDGRYNTLLGVIPALPVCYVCMRGFIKHWKGENLHLSLLLVGTIVVLMILPYSQRLRYLYNVLPILLMFLAYGAIDLWEKLRKKLETKKLRIARYFALVLALSFVLWTGYGVASQTYANLQNGRIAILRDPETGEWDDSAYSAAADDMYRYIRENLPEDASISDIKPRLVYLETGHVGSIAGLNGHAVQDEDYYLWHNYRSDYFKARNSFNPDEHELIYENEAYKLYRINK